MTLRDAPVSVSARFGQLRRVMELEAARSGRLHECLALEEPDRVEWNAYSGFAHFHYPGVVYAVNLAGGALERRRRWATSYLNDGDIAFCVPSDSNGAIALHVALSLEPPPRPDWN